MKKISLSASLRPGRDTGKIVKYTPCSKQESQLDDDLDEIAVVSNAAPEAVKYGSGSLTANGPRVVPGIITTTGGERSRLGMVSDRRSVSSARIHTSSPLYTAKSNENLKVETQIKSASRQSLLESVSSRIHGDHKRRSRESMAYVNRAHVGSDMEISRKTRELRRKEIKKEFEKWETSTSASDKTGCKWTFVFDPSGRLCYYWSMVVSVAFLYNFWVTVYRFSFQEIGPETILGWFAFDYLADLVYVLDVGFHFRTGYLEEGVLQTDSVKLRQHYMNSTMFYIDCLCLLPLDVLYLSIGFNSILRCFRLVKIYRFWAFLDRTERHTNYPNVFRTVTLIHYLLVIFHWNACLYHIISKNGGFGSKDWFNPRDEKCGDVVCEYLHAFYWSTLALTTIGDLPRPRIKGEYLFLTVELIFGLFLFASVLGYVANIVTNVSAARKEFQAKLDAVKTYMRMRRVPEQIQNKVIRWFDYLWMTQKSSDEERSVGCLPDKLKAEIAIHVHLDTLKRVEIFQNTEAGFLCELVLRLRPVLFSPGDYICRKGEVGKEMYIVNRGRLQVVADNGKTVLATLRAGSYFGEISILNMGTAGNRRTASVRSVGYSDLFCLYKQDMWEVLKDYPAARVRLEAIAVKRLEKYKKEPLRKIAMGRSRSTPGLVESRGRVPLEEMTVPLIDPVTSSVATLLSDEDHRTETPLTSAQAGSSASSSGSSRASSSQQQPSVHLPEPHQAPRIVHHPAVVTIPSSGSSSRASGGLQPPPQTIHHFESLSPQALANYTITTSPAGMATSSGVENLLPPGFRSGGRPGMGSGYLSPMPSPYYGQPDYVTSAASGSHDHLQPYQLHHHHHPRTSPLPLSRDSSQEALLAEIKRLREKLVTLESENATMSIKLSQQQWEVENRLAEIELQICGGTSGITESSAASSGSGDENERNRESII